MQWDPARRCLPGAGQWRQPAHCRVQQPTKEQRKLAALRATLRATQASYSLTHWQNPTQSPWHTQHWPAYTLWQRL